MLHALSSHLLPMERSKPHLHHYPPAPVALHIVIISAAAGEATTPMVPAGAATLAVATDGAGHAAAAEEEVDTTTDGEAEVAVYRRENGVAAKHRQIASANGSASANPRDSGAAAGVQVEEVEGDEVAVVDGSQTRNSETEWLPRYSPRQPGLANHGSAAVRARVQSSSLRLRMHQRRLRFHVRA